MGFREQLTAELIAQKLQSWGISHQTGIAKTGIVATIESGKPPVVERSGDAEPDPVVARLLAVPGIDIELIERAREVQERRTARVLVAEIPAS